MKILAALGTLLVVGFGSVFGLFVMVLGLNGFSDHDGGVGISVYLVLALVTIVGATIATPILALRRQRAGKPNPIGMGWVYACLGGSLGLLISITIGIVVASILRG